MPADPSDEKVLAFLRGCRHPDAAQETIDRGDHQIAALMQFLHDAALTENDVVVDFGSGRGLLAKVIKLVYEDRPLPRYFAVDLEHELDNLTLPRQIHNKSKVFAVSDFLDAQLAQHADEISLVVIRNVLHELDIADTCRLFRALNAHLPPTAVIYIQDVVDLPRAEARHAGWRRDALTGFLRDVGIEASTAPLESYGGTNWFFMTARTTGSAVTEKDAIEACVRARIEQKKELLDELRKLDPAERPEDYIREIRINHDIASIEYQIHGVTSPAGTSSDLPQPGANYSVVSPETFGPLDYVAEAPLAMKPSGLVAVLSSKRLLDFAQLLRGAKQFIWSYGYSQRSMFQEEEVRTALYDAVIGGREIRLLVGAPDSPAIIARSREPIYAPEQRLIDDIHFTLHESRKFAALIAEQRGEEYAAKHFQVRATPSIYSSFVIVDDRCYVSLYSKLITGTSAPCLVFQKEGAMTNSYYHTLYAEFEQAWR